MTAAKRIGMVPVLACLLAVAAVPAPAQETPELQAGTLRLATWRGSFLGRGAGGSLALLIGPDGACRVEVADRRCTWTDLLDRSGHGWTAVLGAGADPLVAPWGREWSRLEAPLAAGLATLARALAAPPGPPVRTRNGAATPVRTVALPPADPAPSFRAAQAARGRGRGGPGEILHLVWLTAADRSPVLAVRSSRRPGGLRLGELRCLPVRFPVPETFVPLWSLRELLDAGSEIPGTCHPAGG